MGREYFGTKLMAGRAEASAKMRWWPRHSGAVTRYLELSSSGCRPAEKPGSDILSSGCADWDARMGRTAEGPMVEHGRLEMRLVDAALRVDVREMEKIGALLTENVKRQTEIHAARVPEFPASRWKALFAQHVWLFVESVSCFVKTGPGLYGVCEERRKGNTLALAAFTAEWL